MKKLIYFASLLILAACGSSSSVTTSTPTPTPSTNQTPYQVNREGNFTPPMPAHAYQGPGPVNISQSNFFFAGDFQIMDGMPLFFDCMAGANIPIATDQGIYQELVTQYKAKATSNGEILKAKLHGYFINTPTKDYPKQLVITAVNDLAKGPICNPQKTLPGSWSADLIGTEKGTVALTLTNTFDFNCVITTATGAKTIKGSWMMTSADEIVLLYTDMTNHLGHSVAFNPNNMTLFVPTQTGTLIFKKG